jgi:hypothetical protein
MGAHLALVVSYAFGRLVQSEEVIYEKENKKVRS